MSSIEKNLENESPRAKPEPSTGVYSLAYAQLMQQSALDTGLQYETLAEAGHPYSIQGKPYIVSEGMVYIQIAANNSADFTKFWARVNELKAQSAPRRSPQEQPPSKR